MPSASSVFTSSSLRYRYDWMTVPTFLSCPGSAVQPAHKVDRLLGIGRAFHVHAHEVVDVDRVIDQLGHQPKRQVGIDIEPHVRQLQADVGVQLARRDLVEHPVIKLGAVLRLVGIGDVLAQVIDADRRPGSRHRLSRRG